MADVVTGKHRWDADELFKAIEYAYAYSEGLDDLEAIRNGVREGRPSAMTKALRDAWELIQEVRAEEQEQRWEADFPEVSQQEFDTRFGVKECQAESE